MSWLIGGGIIGTITVIILGFIIHSVFFSEAPPDASKKTSSEQPPSVNKTKVHLKTSHPTMPVVINELDLPQAEGDDLDNKTTKQTSGEAGGPEGPSTGTATDQVTVGRTCKDEFDCRNNELCQGYVGEKTCRVKLNGECAHHEECEDRTVCSDAEKPKLCKAVIGGKCNQDTDCYQKLSDLTGASVAAAATAWSKLAGNSTLEEAAKALNLRTEKADGSNKFPLTGCAPSKLTGILDPNTGSLSSSGICQVFAGHFPGAKPGDGLANCAVTGQRVEVFHKNPAYNLCKAVEGQKCGSPRGEPMHRWCEDGHGCRKRGEDYLCQEMPVMGMPEGGLSLGGAEIQLGERAGAWPLTNASLPETAAHAGRTSNLRGKRTHASALQVDPL